MEKLIEASSIFKSFKKRIILENIDFSLFRGEILAIVGPNGAGKTTFLSILLGILKPDSGSVKLWSKDYKSEIGVHLQSTAFLGDHTGRENLIVFSALYNLKPEKDTIDYIMAKYKLPEKTKACDMSAGEQKKLSIAIANINNPRLLILDEPSSNLDPKERYNIKNLIVELSKQNITILLLLMIYMK